MLFHGCGVHKDKHFYFSDNEQEINFFYSSLFF